MLYSTKESTDCSMAGSVLYFVKDIYGRIKNFSVFFW